MIDSKVGGFVVDVTRGWAISFPFLFLPLLSFPNEPIFISSVNILPNLGLRQSLYEGDTLNIVAENIHSKNDSSILVSEPNAQNVPVGWAHSQYNLGVSYDGRFGRGWGFGGCYQGKKQKMENAAPSKIQHKKPSVSTHPPRGDISKIECVNLQPATPQ